VALTVLLRDARLAVSVAVPGRKVRLGVMEGVDVLLGAATVALAVAHRVADLHAVEVGVLVGVLLGHRDTERDVE